MLFQILLNAVQVAHRQGDILAFHVEADEDDRTGQVALARQLQHLIGVVAARHGQLLGNAEGVIRLVKAGQNAGRFFQQNGAQVPRRADCRQINLRVTVLALCNVAHLVEEAGNGTLHAVDFAVHVLNGLCGLEINRGIHSRCPPKILQKRKDLMGLSVTIFQRSF